MAVSDIDFPKNQKLFSVAILALILQSEGFSLVQKHVFDYLGVNHKEVWSYVDVATRMIEKYQVIPRGIVKRAKEFLDPKEQESLDAKYIVSTDANGGTAVKTISAAQDVVKKGKRKRNLDLVVVDLEHFFTISEAKEIPFAIEHFMENVYNKIVSDYGTVDVNNILSHVPW